jgi:hypothetical protein
MHTGTREMMLRDFHFILPRARIHQEERGMPERKCAIDSLQLVLVLYAAYMYASV